MSTNKQTAKIAVLDETLIRKIAAGEVIERPASVIKELVENALDAGAHRVHVEVMAGGRQSLTVSDDGEGMSREDARLSVERHATSKLRSPSDLFAIQTLGFRGEALASIGAVSRLSIETRCAEESAGTRIVVEGGIQRELSSVARDVGTRVAVRNLFFNTPARRKFLKPIETEARYIAQVVTQLAAAHPEVGFEVVSQERLSLSLLPGERRDRAGELLDIAAEGLLAGEYEEAGIRVEVLLGGPAFCRKTRSRQFLLVRGRPVYSRALNQAVYRGYGGLLPSETHPPFAMWIDLDPRQIDVNVHPTKKEIRLADERLVAQAVARAVRQALEMPETAGFTYAPLQPSYQPLQLAEGTAVFAPAGESSGGDDQMALHLLAPALPQFGIPGEAGEAVRRGDLEGPVRVLQVHDKYLLLQLQDGIAVIDQHVAHERIRFEEALDRFEAEGAPSQQLLMPLTIHLNPVELEAARQAEALLGRLGFGIREFGAGTLLIDAIPAGLRNWQEGALLYKLIDELIQEKEIRDSLQEAMAASYACHTSIRAGERLVQSEMQELVERLLKAREPFVCPHGRPIIVKLSLRELDKLFGRA
ncbi:MAG: DNA mismatch repair endonuclease MutL [Candidatus Latescibacteria bacterium]|nr:DNA mismatch repair endonuclease MutL [Candidatus Latescibacterota bacterium]